MSKIDDFLKFINEKTCNKFSFLRLKQVFFDYKSNLFSVSFIYPNDTEFKDKDRLEIEQAIKDYLKIDVSIDLNINKSFIETDLILNQIKKFMQEHNPMFFSTFNLENIQIEISDIVKITFVLEEQLYDYFIKYKMDKGLSEFLYKNFYTNFEIFAKSIQSSQVMDNFLDERLISIQKQSDLNSLLLASQEKYMITDKKVLIGKEITFNPRYIKSINRPYESCVIAGKINFINEKSYKSKRKIKNKDGTENQIEKPYFNFQIKDDTGSIYGVIFPSKENCHKFRLLNNGDFIAIEGRIQKYGDNFEIMANSISYCKIPNKNEIERVTDQNTIIDYTYVKPQNYTSQVQTNLFEIKKMSNEILTQSFVVYDFETTGVDTNNDEIIEIGALKIVNGEFKEVFTTLVKPRKPIPPEATKVNRITNEMVSNCYYIEQVIKDFYLFCKDCQMVGYNSIAFDSLFLLRAGKKININFDNVQIDAFLLAKQKLKGLKNYKLGTVAKYLDINLIDAHRALNDVIATAEIFIKLY